MFDRIALAFSQADHTRLAAVIEASTDFIGIALPDGSQALYVNSAGRRLVGIYDRDVTKLAVLDFFPPDEQVRVVNEIMPVVKKEGRWVGELDFQHFESKERLPVYWNVFYVREHAQGEPVALACISPDLRRIRAAERNLLESRERLEAALEASGTGTFRWDIRTNSLEWDRNLDALFGLAPQQTAHRLEDFIACVHPDDRAGVTERCGRCAQEGANFEMEFRVVWPDGSIHWLLDKGKTFTDESGSPAYMTGACVDITPRKQVEDEAHASQQRFRELADAMPQIVWTSRGVGGGDYFNRRWTEYTGISVEEGLVRGWELVHPDDLPKAMSTWQEALAQGQPYENEHRFRRHDGQYRWHLVRGVPVKTADGRVDRWYGTCTDIHEHKQTLNRLRRKQEFLRVTHEAAAFGTFEWNIKENVNWWSPELEGLYGLVPGSFAGSYEAWQERVHPEDLRKADAEMRNSLQSGQFYTDFRILRGDGEIRWIHARARILYDENGQAESMVGINMDVTDRRATEEALRQADRRKDEFLAMLAHELRNPLSAISNALHVARLPGLPDEKLRWTSDVLDRQMTQLTRLIDDLLDVARITQGKIQLKKERVLVNAIVQRAVAAVSSLVDSRRHQLTTNLVGDWYCDADPARLEQILVNLLTNAAKYTPTGGQIAIGVRGDDKQLCIEVTDNGTGIPAAMLPHVFELFTQVDRSLERSQGGLGIGLTLVRRLIELHGGQVAVQSKEGQGSTFSVTLPTSAESSRTLEHGPLYRRAARPTSILIVDDNRDSAAMLATLLAHQGHEVSQAFDGEEALEIAQQRLPAIILLDLGLPVKNGFEVAALLRSDPAFVATRLVALSGYGQPDDRRRTAAVGFHEHLVKPVHHDTLMRLIDDMARSSTLS